MDGGQRDGRSETEAVRFAVGGVTLPRPFRIRRLGHFGINVDNMPATLDFYTRLLGFRISDALDLSARVPEALRAEVGPAIGYFTRHGTDHHSFVLFPGRALAAIPERPRLPAGVTVNQITWQVGSLREVVDGHDWFGRFGARIHRAGRDLPGSNWHVYAYDPESHVNELYYGIEQVGWDGSSKPMTMQTVHHKSAPALPQPSELSEVAAALAARIDIAAGMRATEPEAERYDVGGILLARPFKVVRIGPVRLFIRDMEAALAFYRDGLGLAVTEEVVWQGHRCIFLRANTEHHSLALYPLALRDELGLSPQTTLFSFGLQLAEYGQLRAARDFLQGAGTQIRHLPPELFPGIDYSAFAVDPSGHAVQLYYAMEPIGWDGRPRPVAERPRIDNDAWPETIEDGNAYRGEAYLGPWG